MISQKGYVLLVSSLIICLIGLFFQDLQIIILGMFLLLFLVLVRSISIGEVNIIRRTGKLKVYEDDELKMELLAREHAEDKKFIINHLSNKMVEIEDGLPGYAALSENSNHKLFHLTPKKFNKVQYKIYCPLRGLFTIGPMHVKVSDNFRIFEKDLLLENDHEFSVNIGYKTIKKFNLRTKAFDWNMGTNLLNIQGKSSEFYSIRDYTKQDSYREINWKASARKRKLMVNTFERETLNDCCIFIDARDMCGLGRPHDNFIEYSIRIAFGVAKSIIDNNNRLSLVCYGNNIRMIPPGMGKNHSAYINALLIDTPASGFITFYHALQRAQPYLKPKSTVIIFSPLDYDQSLFESMVYLQSMAMKVIVVTSSLLTFESRALKRFTVRNELDQELRKFKLQELKGLGVRVIDWEPEDDFGSILEQINLASGLKEISNPNI
jgi:uncharacterized protein (DUF58 family)